ncbi:MCE family protein [Mycolicibacterium mucogenicum]|uniref:MCE family protein n=1 Tax=Mycolicibacterium mucogenicum TaxID=56689 RepID=UPI0022699E7B|nr:MCE family protein [Mycolicibacterium mucogenicum]MCX8555621.1 MCE family protein [Mycolicibacterium mucogenicum]
MRSIEGSDRVRRGAMGLAAVVLVTAVGASVTKVPMLFASPTYYGQFSDTGGLMVGDYVRIDGVNVGTVKDMDIDRDKVIIGFDIGTNTIGTDSRALIKTETILGRKAIEIEAKGTHKLPPRGTLPLSQTSTPYQIYDAIFDVTRASQGWDTKVVKESLNVLSETVDQTSPHLTAALEGVQKLSETIGKRDDQIRALLGNANKIATILGDRSGQINALLVNAQTLLHSLNQRGEAIGLLLERVSRVSHQLQATIDENPNINHVLEQLRTISDILVARKQDLSDTLVSAGKFVASLSEAVASGPYFKIMVANILPPQLMQPFVDAAFKKRGLNPEDFWRSAGLPEAQWPDPNGTRFANGAPPPAPPKLEGTPEHPGPAVPPGSPCSYTPGAGADPTPADPLPCSHLSVGPFGGPDYAPPNVVSSAPNPAGVPTGPGVPSAAFPGQPAENVPGTPVPLPPAPVGARTVPLTPQPGDSDIAPGFAPIPGPLIAPPAPPGPGPSAGPAGTAPLPGNPPFLPPGSQG